MPQVHWLCGAKKRNENWPVIIEIHYVKRRVEHVELCGLMRRRIHMWGPWIYLLILYLVDLIRKRIKNSQTSADVHFCLKKLSFIFVNFRFWCSQKITWTTPVEQSYSKTFHNAGLIFSSALYPFTESNLTSWYNCNIFMSKSTYALSSWILVRSKSFDSKNSDICVSKLDTKKIWKCTKTKILNSKIRAMIEKISSLCYNFFKFWEKGKLLHSDCMHKV